jgi:hypothetical protein
MGTPRYMGLGWKGLGDMGTFKVPFMDDGQMRRWMTRRTDGWKASSHPRRRLLYKNIRSPFLYLFFVSVFLSLCFLHSFSFSILGFRVLGFRV